MTQFKVGDRVRHKISGARGNVADLNQKIASGSYGQIQVRFDFEIRDRTVSVGDLEKWPSLDDEFSETVSKLSSDPVAVTADEHKEISKLGKEMGISSFEQSVRRHTDRIANLLIEKNKQYSNSALDPIRVFSKADRTEQLRVRADDKLSRIRNGDTSEDAVLDLCGYLILLRMAAESE